MNEIEVLHFETPQIVWNYAEYKQSLDAELEKFRHLVYTADTIGEAKKDRAKLNHLADDMNQRKRSIRDAYCAPYDKFEAEVKELMQMVKEVSLNIDNAVKEYEESEKMAKREAIKDLFNHAFDEFPAEISFEKIERSKWLNKSVTMAAIEREIKDIRNVIESDLQYIRALDDSADIEFDYLNTLRLSDALAAHKKRAEFKKKTIEVDPSEIADVLPLPNPDAYEVSLRVKVTDEQLDELLKFINANGIELIL